MRFPSDIISVIAAYFVADWETAATLTSVGDTWATGVAASEALWAMSTTTKRVDARDNGGVLTMEPIPLHYKRKVQSAFTLLRKRIEIDPHQPLSLHYDKYYGQGGLECDLGFGDDEDEEDLLVLDIPTLDRCLQKALQFTSVAHASGDDNHPPSSLSTQHQPRSVVFRSVVGTISKQPSSFPFTAMKSTSSWCQRLSHLTLRDAKQLPVDHLRCVGQYLGNSLVHLDLHFTTVVDDSTTVDNSGSTRNKDPLSAMAALGLKEDGLPLLRHLNLDGMLGLRTVGDLSLLRAPTLQHVDLGDLHDATEATIALSKMCPDSLTRLHLVGAREASAASLTKITSLKVLEVCECLEWSTKKELQTVAQFTESFCDLCEDYGLEEL